MTGIDERFNEFTASKDTLRVYNDEALVFSSQKERLAPLMQYINQNSKFKIQNSKTKSVIVFDRVVGNAAALLLTMINCREVFSELGSEMAVKTLETAGIKYHFKKTVDCVKDDSGENMCPMERLSQGKASEEFYRAMQNMMKPKS